MKYVILSGDTINSEYWKDESVLFSKVKGESLVERTVRILKELGINDIYIFGQDERYNRLGIKYVNYGIRGCWVNEFFNSKEPTCFLFGNVYYSYSAIQKMINAPTTDIDFFVSTSRLKNKDEGIGFKVVDCVRFFLAINKVRQLYNSEIIKNCDAFELWRVIEDNTRLAIRYDHVYVINDFTCAVEYPDDTELIENKASNQTIMIHCVPNRLFYVYNFIIPALEEQLIDDIIIYNDANMSGNLTSFINSLKTLPEEGSTWHIQDDVLLSPRFANVINKSDSDKVICGFSSKYDRSNEEFTTPKDMWWTFPCIKIPNRIAKEFIEWCTPENMKYSRFKDCIKANKGDDALFKEFLEETHGEETVINLIPNIVNHVDYMLGGSVSNPQRYNVVKKVTARFWPEEEKILMDELQQKIIKFNS